MALAFSVDQWYTGLSSPSQSAAQEAFEDAKTKFEGGLSNDSRKIEIVQDSTSIEDVRTLLDEAKAKYESTREHSKVRRWLVKLAERIHFYGGVLDVFAQHHPEYVALAWGSIKFLLTAVLNHEKTISILAKAMTRIADTLPRVKLHSVLYPTTRMKNAVAELYAYILRFFIRARDWYNEYSIKRALYAVLRPVELRYNELLEQIEEKSRMIDQLAASGQQAELREMHIAIKSTDDKVEKMMELVQKTNASVTLQSSKMIDTNSQLNDLQFDRIIALLDVAMPTPEQIYSAHHSLRRQRQKCGVCISTTDNFWKSPKMRRWCLAQQSSISMILADFQSRFMMRDLCVDVIEQLKQAQIPYLLAMRTPHSTKSPGTMPVSDVLNYLIKQAIKLSEKDQTEKSMALSCAMFHDASTEMERFCLLEAILAGIGQMVYIIIDLDLLDKTTSECQSFSWISAFEKFIVGSAARGSSTRIKVLFVGCRTCPFPLSVTERKAFVVSVKSEIVTARLRKKGRSPQAAATSFRLGILPKSPSRRTRTGASCT